MKTTLRLMPLAIFALAAPLGVACDAVVAAEPAPPVIVGLVSATEIDVASKIPGRLAEVTVREGDTVPRGALLVRLESAELDARAAQAEAVIAAANARLDLAREGARPEEKRALRSAVNAARHQVDLTRKMVDRMGTLNDQRVVPEVRLDEATFRYDTASDQLKIARAKLAAVNAGARDEEIAALEALVGQAEAALAEVNAYRRETEQRAPIAGLVAKVYRHAGELASAGGPILTLVDRDDVWVSFAVREDLLRNLQVGELVDVEVPALGRTVPMEVQHLAVLGEFATWRATSDRDRFDLKTFEVRLRPTAPIDALRPGMSARWAVTAAGG